MTRAPALIDELVTGSFESWCEPHPEVAAELATSLGLRLAETFAGGSDPTDDLTRWWTTRARSRWGAVPRDDLAPVETDGHRVFIARHDVVRSPERVRRMSDALAFVRAEARAQRAHTWSMLREAQRRVLGVAAVGLRMGDAVAHQGRERYALHDETLARFERCLAEANDRALSPAARGARVYLDVCFVHPFEDGNARAARLALDYVLIVAGLALRAAEPVFLLARREDDPLLGSNVTHLLAQLSGPVQS